MDTNVLQIWLNKNIKYINNGVCYGDNNIYYGKYIIPIDSKEILIYRENYGFSMSLKVFDKVVPILFKITISDIKLFYFLLTKEHFKDI